MGGEGRVTERMGVFLCDCGDEIASVVDLPRLAADLKALDESPVVRRALYWCSKRGCSVLAEAIAEQELDAVVVAGCSSRTHGDLVVDVVGLQTLHQTVGSLVVIHTPV